LAAPKKVTSPCEQLTRAKRAPVGSPKANDRPSGEFEVRKTPARPAQRLAAHVTDASERLGRTPIVSFPTLPRPAAQGTSDTALSTHAMKAGRCGNHTPTDDLPNYRPALISTGATMDEEMSIPSGQWRPHFANLCERRQGGPMKTSVRQRTPGSSETRFDHLLLRRFTRGLKHLHAVESSI
jgi:hypothetical protein